MLLLEWLRNAVQPAAQGRILLVLLLVLVLVLVSLPPQPQVNIARGLRGAALQGGTGGGGGVHGGGGDTHGHHVMGTDARHSRLPPCS